MAVTPDIAPDGWRIEERADGWALRWRPPVTSIVPGLPSLYGLLPAYRTRRWIQGLLIAPWYVGEIASLAGYDVDARAPALSPVAFVFAVWAIWDLMLNFERGIVMNRNVVRLWGSSYHLACLASARVAASWSDCRRYKVLITSSSGSIVSAVGWPGVSELTARAICEALAQRGCRSSSDDAVRTNRCSGLAVESSGVASPLGASR